jgi:hypothetical protein
MLFNRNDWLNFKIAFHRIMLVIPAGGLEDGLHVRLDKPNCSVCVYKLWRTTTWTFHYSAVYGAMDK